MRAVFCGAVALSCCPFAMAQAPASLPKKVVLIPLDDRPVSTQLPKMLGDIGGVEVVLPPRELLGRFDRPGNPEGIMEWMSSPGGMPGSDAVIVSLDMVTCGGLIASRSSATHYELAKRRLFRLWQIRQEAPKAKFYVFSSIVRLAPTATREAAPYRMLIQRWMELKEEAKRLPKPETKKRLASLEERIPSWELERSLSARRRMVRLSGDLMQIMGLKGFDLAAFGQDDASPMGIHLSEIDEVRASAKIHGAEERVNFLQGIDQVASVLLARACSEVSGATLGFSTSYSSLMAARQPAPYEAVPIEASLRQQVRAAGARLDPSSPLRLMVNTAATESELSGFRTHLMTRLKSGQPTALADVNLGKAGTGDPRLVEGLMASDVLPRLQGYAGWNTAANSMGTVLPMLQIHELAKRADVPFFVREAKLRRVLFHRLVSDWLYHRYTRPLAYQMIDRIPNSAREELTADQWRQVSKFVHDDLSRRTQEAFSRTLEGEILEEGNWSAKLETLRDLRISLPWPRAYEVEVDFELGFSEVK